MLIIKKFVGSRLVSGNKIKNTKSNSCNWHAAQREEFLLKIFEKAKLLKKAAEKAKKLTRRQELELYEARWDKTVRQLQVAAPAFDEFSIIFVSKFDAHFVQVKISNFDFR